MNGCGLMSFVTVCDSVLGLRDWRLGTQEVLFKILGYIHSMNSYRCVDPLEKTRLVILLM